MQLIYGGKTSKSFPQLKLLDSFTLSANERHCSNKQESLKLLDDVIIPNVKMEREKLEQLTQATLMIMDAFKGQTTKTALQKIACNNARLVKVPPNLTYIYQPFEL